jgi:hypothetical protein
VDIDPGAVEIAKLRLWLSLVVDEDDIKNIKPLPNLDYKIVCGNSLLAFPYKPRGLKKIESLKNKFINETRPNEKTKLRKEIDDAIYGLYRNTEKSLGYKVTMDFKVNFSEVFHNKGGFDIVIANPPYGLLNKRQNKAQTIVVTPEELNYYKTSTEYDPARGGMINIFRLFILKSICLIQKSGVLSEIFPLAFIADASAAKLRKYILNRCSLRLIEAFPE